MKVLIDTNILLDVLENRKPFVDDSSLIWKLSETERIHGCVSALSFPNIVYILRKELKPEKVNEVLQMLLLIFDFQELNASDLRNAGELMWQDYEDALQCVTAERIGAHYIITRNVKDFNKSKITAVTPPEFIAMIKDE